MKKILSLSLSFILVMLLVGGSVYGFSDIENDPGRDQIRSLKESNIISGISKDRFGPQQHVHLSHAVVMIVNALHLNLDAIQFIKAPKASDYFDHISDEAWYAKAFIVAHHNGIDLPRDVDPQAKITKEEFTHYLFQAMLQTGDYAFIELYVHINDSEDINEAYMDSIQKMVISNIASLDKDQNFHPKAKITRSEAAILLYETRKFVKDHAKKEPGDLTLPDLKPNDDVEVIVTPIDDQVNRVTLDWGEQPNPGYGISVQRIEFDHSKKKARVIYQLHYPDPERMYPQVIVHAKTETFVAAGYEIEALQAIDKGTVIGEPNPIRPIKPAPIKPPKIIK